MIVAARMGHSMAIGWYTETFARTKRMKPLGKLLEPEMPARAKAASGTVKVAAMFKRMQHMKKEAADGVG
jgi:hypothetical protein